MNRKQRRKQRSGSERAGASMVQAPPEAQFRAAYEHHRAGRLKEARSFYARALAGRPDNPELLHMAGVAAYEGKNFDEAVHLIGKALECGLRRPEVYNNFGNALQRSGRAAEAVAAFREALRLAPGYADAHYNLGNLFLEAGRLDEALEQYEWALKTQPNDPQIHYNRGMALQAQGLHEEAVRAYRRAIEINPDHAGALVELGSLLNVLGRPRDAIDYLRPVVDRDPRNLGALINLAGALDRTGGLEEALIVFRKSLAIDPSHPKAAAGYLATLEYACSWDDAARLKPGICQATLEALEKGNRPAEEPFEAVGRCMDHAYLLRIAQIYSHLLSARTAPLRHSVPAIPKPPTDGRITIGYLSSDFRDHPVGQLIHGLFSLHDRAAFRVIAYSAGPNDGSIYRRRVETGCDVFVDIQGMETVPAARRIREDGVDILIDLNGHTARNRLDILALRPAPVQVTYLGYPGTTGADFIDYMLADAVVIPPDQAVFFSEKIVYLPGSYMINSRHPIRDRRISRDDCELPENGFVFCSFCRNNKFEQVMFGTWMDILHQVPGSVIWLPNCNPIAKGNLLRAANDRGIAASRVVFAARLDAKEDHLARSRLADLALDTRIFGGHTTTSDMLWAGVPVITLLGAHFASRVGASLLKAMGLEELVATSLEEYRDLAVRLAQDRVKLGRFRQRLEVNRSRSSLFDTPRFARNLEKAFTKMWARRIAGLDPTFIIIADN